MKKYPISTFKELGVDVSKAINEIRNITNWQEWNVIKPVGASTYGLYEIDFGIYKPILFPNLYFSFIPTQNVNEVNLTAVLASKKELMVEWIFTFKEEEQVMVHSILLSGNFAKTYYAQFGTVLMQTMKQMNRNLKAYLHQPIIDKNCLLEQNNHSIKRTSN